MSTPTNVFGITAERLQELYEGDEEMRREASEEIWGELCRHIQFVRKLKRAYYTFLDFGFPSESQGDRTAEEHAGWLKYLKEHNVALTEENR